MKLATWQMQTTHGVTGEMNRSPVIFLWDKMQPYIPFLLYNNSASESNLEKPFRHVDKQICERQVLKIQIFATGVGWGHRHWSYVDREGHLAGTRGHRQGQGLPHQKLVEPGKYFDKPVKISSNWACWNVFDFVIDFPPHPILQPADIGWPTGNGKKLSSTQAQLGQATCLCAA